MLLELVEAEWTHSKHWPQTKSLKQRIQPARSLKEVCSSCWQEQNVAHFFRLLPIASLHVKRRTLCATFAILYKCRQLYVHMRVYLYIMHMYTYIYIYVHSNSHSECMQMLPTGQRQLLNNISIQGADVVKLYVATAPLADARCSSAPPTPIAPEMSEVFGWEP